MCVDKPTTLETLERANGVSELESYSVLLLFHLVFFPARAFSTFKLNIVSLTWILQGNLIYSGANILSILYSFPLRENDHEKNGIHLPFRKERWNQSKCRRSKLDFKVWKLLVKNQSKTYAKRNSMSFGRRLLMGLSDTVSPIPKYVFDLWKKNSNLKNSFPFSQISGGGVVASWLARSSPDRLVLVRALALSSPTASLLPGVSVNGRQWIVGET